MQLGNLLKEKEAFEERLRAVIQGEINKFLTDGGLAPEHIMVDMFTHQEFGKEDQHLVRRVRVGFGL